MTCNVGGADRALRVVVAAAALAAGLFWIESTGWRLAAFLVAAMATFTAVSRYCPLNHLLHINSCRHRIDRP